MLTEKKNRLLEWTLGSTIYNYTDIMESLSGAVRQSFFFWQSKLFLALPPDVFYNSWENYTRTQPSIIKRDIKPCV